MSEHPIQGLMTTAMQSIKDMIDVNTVIGDAVETQEGGVVIPVSRVSFGFAAGGGEYGASGSRLAQGNAGGDAELPFGGGSGAGVSVQPVGFLVLQHDDVRFIPIDQSALIERVIDQAPELIGQIGDWFRPKAKEMSDQTAQHDRY